MNKTMQEILDYINNTGRPLTIREMIQMGKTDWIDLLQRTGKNSVESSDEDIIIPTIVYKRDYEVLDFFWSAKKIMEFLFKEIESYCQYMDKGKKLLSYAVKSAEKHYLSFYGLDKLHLANYADMVMEPNVESDTEVRVNFGIEPKFPFSVFNEWSQNYRMIVKSVYSTAKEVEIVPKAEYDRVFLKKQEVLAQNIAEILIGAPKYQLDKEELHRRLNIYGNISWLTKPYPTEVIDDAVSSYAAFFNAHKNNVSLTMPIEFIESIARANEFEFSDIATMTVPEKGIVFIEFNGTEFPFEDAVEYVNYRPIIYVGSQKVLDEIQELIENLKEYYEIQKIQDEEEKYDRETSFAPYLLHESQFLRNCFAFCLNESYYDESDPWWNMEKLADWLGENTKILIYEPRTDVFTLGEFTKRMVEEYSPILNIEDNPKNILKYTLTGILKDFYAKVN